MAQVVSAEPTSEPSPWPRARQARGVKMPPRGKRKPPPLIKCLGLAWLEERPCNSGLRSFEVPLLRKDLHDQYVAMCNIIYSTHIHIYIYAYILIYIYTYIHMYICTYVHVYTHVCANMCVYV